ncbi:hypothetical protein CA13_58940 [Planctomycetes bacterium CA13]|uniref:F5/8 type C domain protein n=1 Tax=Novipirellula herctigrandis TaxID=2527986 RepID=A0A5C5ZB89_9BACT|nr:hypothetical protein CA13_58940 [Planctomycetes bacterium CA13]
MKSLWRIGLVVVPLLVVAAVFADAAVCADEIGVPQDSAIGESLDGLQRLLLNPMDDVVSVNTGAWKMNDAYVSAANDVAAKLGCTALTLGGDAEQPGAKGDFTVSGSVAGETQTIGLWVHLTKEANVAQVGVQLADEEGESLVFLVPADWTGWKWVEVDLADVVQAYPQTDKNRVVDYPIQNVHVAWFAKAAGPAFLTVDSIVALTRLEDTTESSNTAKWSVPERVDAGNTLSASVYATNFSDQPFRYTVRYSLQRDPAFYSQPLPDPVFGSDHAAGAHSWLVFDGKIVEDTGSTDGKLWTSPTTNYQKEHYTEALQFVDLGQVRDIRKMTWSSGDANHTWFVDVFASEDGETFNAVPSLKGVDHHKKWGWNEFPMEEPFRARVLKFRYRTAGGRENLIAFPAELGIYDGADDEVIALPQVGPVVEEGTVEFDVPARSFSTRVLSFSRPLDSGAYLLGLSLEHEGSREHFYRHVFCNLEEQPELITKDSRIALNSADVDLVPKLRELGVGFVRFENGKWPFVSANPHQYAFNGEVAPWHLSLDNIFQSYHEAGIGVLTYMFLTPQWASSAPADALERMRASFPPQDLSLYGEFCFQMAARYGSVKHPEDVLLTTDKRSGMDLVKYYEMWNEPNLNPSPEATWGGWAAPVDTYYEMMKFGAEAVKRADPNALVTSAGYAGMSTDVVDPLRLYEYPDGTHPLDLIDLINVHFYSGHEPPETCRTDGNAKVTSSTTFPENLRQLSKWRDRYAPEMPIWMTETGYDSAGPFGTTEAIQAARLPRVVMLCLANGIEKVFVYRETGSTPSQHACSGVLRNDFSRKPSWYTLGTAIRQMHGVNGGARRLPHPDENVWLMEWDASGKPLLTAWTVNGTTRLGNELGACTVTDSFGGTAAVDGTGEIEITPYPLYLTDFAGLDRLGELRAEYDRREAAQAIRLDKIAKLRKYLFDFGSTERVGRDSYEGHPSDYVPVLSTNVRDEENAFGFDKPALRDDDQPWMGNAKLDRDGTRVRDHVFQFSIAPGRYDLTMKVVPFSDRGQLNVTGVVGGPLTIDVQKDDPVKTFQIEVAGDDPVLGVQVNNDYGYFRWIRCVECL